MAWDEKYFQRPLNRFVCPKESNHQVNMQSIAQNICIPVNRKSLTHIHKMRLHIPLTKCFLVRLSSKMCEMRYIRQNVNSHSTSRPKLKKRRTEHTELQSMRQFPVTKGQKSIGFFLCHNKLKLEQQKARDKETQRKRRQDKSKKYPVISKERLGDCSVQDLLDDYVPNYVSSRWDFYTSCAQNPLPIPFKPQAESAGCLSAFCVIWPLTEKGMHKRLQCSSRLQLISWVCVKFPIQSDSVGPFGLSPSMNSTSNQTKRAANKLNCFYQ